MKKKILFIILLLMFIFVGCSTDTDTSSEKDDVSGNTNDVNIEEDEINTGFSLVDDKGNTYTANNNVYEINSGGVYIASGKLEEYQIYVNVSNENVEIDLEGVSITNSSVAPIFVNDCDTFELKVKKDTTNYIYDTRSTDYSESSDDTIATAAIYVRNGNLKITGKGTLSVTSNYNNGIHGKDNVTIKNCTILIKAMNNGIKGNDKVTIEGDPTIGIVAGNNGIRTSNSDKGSQAQHGYIYIYGGTITINSYGDGIDAAYAVVINESTDADNTYIPIIDIYTNKYSSYTKVNATNIESGIIELGSGRPGGFGGGGFNGGGFSGGSSAEKADDSAKGIKANESIDILGGKIFIYSYDDGIHTNNDTLDTGTKANANINISGGDITIKASDDGIHADGTLNIKGGTILINESHEGIEAKIINISDGETTVYGDDDGVNASNQINISGGKLDVTVSPNGDTDGIDSNGTITISGGTIITRGPNSEMAAPIDADGTMKMTGGILIVIGYAPRSLQTSLTKTTSSNGLSSGSHTVTIGSNVISFTNLSSYSGSCTVYASGSATVK